MGNFIQGAQLRTMTLGNQVVTAAAAPPNSGSSGNLFTVAGGAVLVTSMFGRVTTALSGTTGSVSLGVAPTVGTANTSGIATTTVIGGKEAGTLLAPFIGAAGAPGAMVAPASAGTVVFDTTDFVVNAGFITWSTTVATMTGAVVWYLTYVPLDTGASVS